jgi:hypothetical protein
MFWVAMQNVNSAEMFVSPPSILHQCLDQPVTVGVGPSARARECTRQYCASAEYQAKIKAYVMNHPQSTSDQKEALTCITRKEKDQHTGN